MLRARLFELGLRDNRSEIDKIEALKLVSDFGSQIGNCVLAPYRLVQDMPSELQMGDVDPVLDGDLDRFMHAFLGHERTLRRVGEAV